MKISSALQLYGQKCFVSVKDSETLADALEVVRTQSYAINATFLIVQGPDLQFKVMLFLELERVIGMIGYDAFVLPLQDLPIPLADRVVQIDAKEDGKAILAWVVARPNSSVVVTKNNEAVGLFVNQHRAADMGWFGPVSYLKLHGELVPLLEDPRSEFENSIERPVCQHCQHKDFFRFNARRGDYTCRNCNKIQS